MRFASHFSPRLLDEVDALSEQSLPIAEINRRVGAKAQKLGVTIARTNSERTTAIMTFCSLRILRHANYLLLSSPFGG